MAHLTGGIGYNLQTTQTVGSSNPQMALGTRARDANGNEYIYVDFQAAFTAGEVVAISTTWTATDVTTATVGPIGVTLSTASSDTCGWVQIYGTGAALGSSLLVIGPVGLGDTSDGYSYLLPLTTALIQVSGIYVTLGTTGGTSGTGSSAFALGTSTDTAGTSTLGGLVTVQLNYPFVEAGVHATESS